LILAFTIVSIIALLYGISPSWFASTFLGIDDLGVMRLCTLILIKPH
jgi:hypothetical protein